MIMEDVYASPQHHRYEKGSYDNYKYFELSRPVRKSWAQQMIEIVH